MAKEKDSRLTEEGGRSRKTGGKHPHKVRPGDIPCEIARRIQKRREPVAKIALRRADVTAIIARAREQLAIPPGGFTDAQALWAWIKTGNRALAIRKQQCMEEWAAARNAVITAGLVWHDAWQPISPKGDLYPFAKDAAEAAGLDASWIGWFELCIYWAWPSFSERASPPFVDPLGIVYDVSSPLQTITVLPDMNEDDVVAVYRWIRAQHPPVIPSTAPVLEALEDELLSLKDNGATFGSLPQSDAGKHYLEIKNKVGAQHQVQVYTLRNAVTRARKRREITE